MRLRRAALLSVPLLLLAGACDSPGGGGSGFPFPPGGDTAPPGDASVPGDVAGDEGADLPDGPGDDAGPGDATAPPPDSGPADTSAPGDTTPIDTAPPSDTAPADTAPPSDTAPADTAPPSDTAPADTGPADTAPEVDACVDTCPQAGATACDGNGVIQCLDGDADGCLEWSAPAPCTGSQDACVDGACLCQPACAVAECGDDGCGGDCGPCVGGALCVDAGCVIPAVVINEVLYDGPSTDKPHVFLELKGPPGLPLDGLAVEGVNGNGGGVTGTIALSGALPADGYLVIAHPEASAALLAVADVLDTAVDFQNGPDSVRLLSGDAVLDAVGYGDFTDAVFAGEGSPAPGAPANAGLSVARLPDGVDTGDNGADFGVTDPTPGEANKAPAPPVPSP